MFWFLFFQCREKYFNLRHYWTSEQARRFSSLEEGKGNTDDKDEGWTGEGKDGHLTEDNPEESSEQNEDESVVGCRQKKERPMPMCYKEVVHHLRHLGNIHGWSSENARAATSRFKLRKKYTFTDEEMASPRNRKVRKARPVSETNKKKPNRKRKLCPVQGCRIITDRLPQRLRRKHKLNQSDAEYRNPISFAKTMSSSKPHVFLRMKEEERRKNKELRWKSSKFHVTRGRLWDWYW